VNRGAINSKQSPAGERQVGEAPATKASAGLFGVACSLFGMLILSGALLGQNVITTVAGKGAAGLGVAGSPLMLPTGVAADAAGNFYIADTSNCVIWKVSNGGSTVFAGTQGNCTPGTGANPATLAYPVDVASCNGNVYFATHGVDPVLPAFTGKALVGGSVYKVDSSGNMTLLPTPATAGGAGPPFPVALACDASGNVFVSSYFYGSDSKFGDSVVEIFPVSSTPQVLISLEGTAFPGVAVDAFDNVFVLNAISTTGWLGVSSFGSGGLLELTGSGNGSTIVNVSGLFENPSRLALDASGNFYVTQSTAAANPTVYVTTVPRGGGSQTPFAGNGFAGYIGQGTPPTQAELKNATGVAFDGCGSLYIADAGNQVVRKVFNSATASSAPCTSGSGGTGSGPTTVISLTSSAPQVTPPQAVSFYANVTVNNCSSCTAPLQGEVLFCYAAAPSSNPCGPGGTTIAAVLVNGPGNTSSTASVLNYSLPGGGSYSVAAMYIDPAGVLPSATSESLNDVVCGSTCPDPGIPGISQSAYPIALTPGVLSTPEKSPGVMAFDSYGFTYFLNSAAGTVTRLDSAGGSSQIVASLNNPSDMVVGVDGNLYITDTGNNRVVAVTSPAGANPVVSPIVLPPSFSPGLKSPTGIAASTSNTLWVTDTGNNRVVAFGTSGGFPSVVFSSATPGAPAIGSLLGIAVNPVSLEVYVANAPAAGSSALGNIIATQIGGPVSILPTPGVTLQSPYGLALDPSNGLYFSDTGMHQIYRMDVYGNVIVVAGNGTATETGDGVSATQTGLANPTWIALDLSNNIWFTDAPSVREVNVREAIVDFTAANQSQTIYLTSPIAGFQGPIAYAIPPSPYLTGPGSSSFMVQPAPLSTCLQPSFGPGPNLSPNTSCSLEVTLLNNASSTYAGIQFQSEIETSLGSFNPAAAFTQPILLVAPGSSGPTTLQITPTIAPNGTYGSPYSPMQFLAGGGSGQVTFAISTGSLPNGLSLSATGLLSGTPTQAGVFPFTISASDTNQDSGSRSYSLTVNPTISISPTSASVAAGQSQQFTSTVLGVSSVAVTWSVQSGGVGGTISSTGLYKAPSSGGIDTVIATVTAFPGASASATVTVAAAAPPPLISIIVPEIITTTDVPAFFDIPVSESIAVSDQVAITPLIGIAGVPAAAYSASSLGFNNTAQSVQFLTVSNVGQATLAFVGSYSISLGFSVEAIQCSDGTTTMPTSLLSGGQCTFSITYAGTSPNGTITFTDNAGLSSPSSTPAPPNYTQTVQLNGGAPTSVPIGLPSATVTIPTIYEAIQVADTPISLAATSGVRVTSSGFLYSRATHTFNGTVTVTNINSFAIPGPLQVGFAGLPVGVTLTNATTSNGGIPFISLARGLSPGQSASFTVQFSDPSNLSISFSPIVHLGAF